MPRHRVTASVLAVLITACAVVFSTQSAIADPVTKADGNRRVTVSEAANLPATDAVLTVTGTGFDPAIEVYVAVCTAASPVSLTDCVGGAVPDDNNSESWAQVTSAGGDRPNAVPFGDGGSFDATLTLSAVVSSSTDCVSGSCVLVVRSAGDAGSRPADITIPLAFAAETSSSSSSSSAESTTSDPPSTVAPENISLPTAVVGDQQTITFNGFAADEDVRVTVYSAPVDIPGIAADGQGDVFITFRITDALVVGEHRVEVIGTRSGTIGIANFAVIPPPVVTSSTPDTSVSSSAPESTSSAAVTSAETTSQPETSSAAVTTTSDTAVTPVTPTDSGSNLWWLWVLLVLLVVVAGIVAAVLMSRRRAQQLEQERLDREHELAAAEAPWQPAPAPRPGPGPASGAYGYNDPGQSGGLLSGRQGDGPALYSGQQSGYPAPPPPGRYEPPTQRIDPATQRINPAGSSPRGGQVPPTVPPSDELPTTAFRAVPPAPRVPPAPGVPPSTGPVPPQGPTTAPQPPVDEPPHTQQWSPFDEEDPRDTDLDPPK